MAEVIRILHLEDSIIDARLIEHLLERGGLNCVVTRVQDEAGYRTALQPGKKFDIILSDYRLGPYDGERALTLARQVCPDIPFVMVTGELGEDRAIETIKRGATDYVLKDNLKRLIPAINRALEEASRERQRREIEAKLRLFSEAIDCALDGIQIVGMDGLILYSNNAVEQIYGFTPEEFAGKHVDTLNVDPTMATRVILPSLQQTGRWAGELLVKHRSGTHFPIWLTCSLVKDDRGVPVANVGIIRDITERKRAEDLLHAQEHLLREVFNSAPVLFWIAGTDAQFTYVNKSALTFTGKRPEDLLGSGWTRGIHPADLQRYLAAYYGAFAARKEFTLSYRLLSSNGEHRTILDRGMPLYDSRSNFLGYVGCACEADRQETAQIEEAPEEQEG